MLQLRRANQPFKPAEKTYWEPFYRLPPQEPVQAAQRPRASSADKFPSDFCGPSDRACWLLGLVNTLMHLARNKHRFELIPANNTIGIHSENLMFMHVGEVAQV
ncbi:hypothetical protein DBR47_17290 [Paucibacter sp. KBW04]|nr:hypothetical protein DBR47_17290 [Paucibacter sp. KBW04]